MIAFPKRWLDHEVNVGKEVGTGWSDRTCECSAIDYY